MARVDFLHVPFHTTVFDHHFLRNGRNTVILQGTDVTPTTIVDLILPSGRRARGGECSFGMRLESGHCLLGFGGGDIVVENLGRVFNAQLPGFLYIPVSTLLSD